MTVIDGTDRNWDLLSLKKSIPSECYQSDTVTSLYYAGRSAAFAIFLLSMYIFCLNNVQNIYVLAFISPLYWFCQGTVFWGIFTIGHDCGHRSFSSRQWLNDLVGTIYHGFILVPFYPWKMSHQHHHKNTGNIDKDEIFYPLRESDSQRLTWRAKVFIDNGFLLGLGWMTYLMAGFPGINYTRNFSPETLKGKKLIEVNSAKHSHFNPNDPMWDNGPFLAVTSVTFVFGMLATTFIMGLKFGFVQVLACYYAPWFVFASYLVVVTFLHHASDESRWLDGSLWNYARGQLENTVDRDYGAIVNNVSHNIGTHVVHHLFPIIPHYKLVEANKYLKKYTSTANLPHHEVSGCVSGLGEFAKQAMNYKEGYVVPDDALIYSVKKGVILQKSN